MTHPQPHFPMEEPTLAYHPGVFLIEQAYEIILICRRNALASVVVDGLTFTDNVNGVMRTDTEVHKIKVPMELLDKARRYRVHLAPLADHCNYYPKPSPTEAYEYDFTPVPTEGPVEAYVLADTHGDAVAPAEAVLRHGPIDLLILLGDIGDSAATREQVTTLHRLTAAVTEGRFPAVYVRGNHDTRGYMAEHLSDYIPTRDGATYYTFRAGPIWGVVLDCGEDKPDTNIEYGLPETGGVANFLPFRNAQTQYLRDLIANADITYNAEGITHRIALCHINFTYTDRPYNDKNPTLYEKWIAALNEIGIDMLICGHEHKVGIQPADYFHGIPVPRFDTLLTAARQDHPEPLKGGHKPGEYTGTALTFTKNGITHVFTNHVGDKLEF
ncbi:MAG: metallophosphoesterase [Clostridia bacterium]|nr:metallophosphoesterase [Clostridia bacterium]